MKEIEHNLIVCGCGDATHNLIISNYQMENKYEKINEYWITISLNENTFWQRLKYLFKRRKTFVEIYLTKDNAKRMINELKKVK